MARLRANIATRHVSILMISAADEVAMLDQALDFGATDYLTLPCQEGELAGRALAMIRAKRYLDQLRSSMRQGLHDALTDPLTGLHNRRYSMTHLPRLLDNARRSGKPLAVMMLDLDRFKDFNDRFGHAVGDEVLIQTARRLRRGVRSADFVARYGGEEFLIAMPNACRHTAAQIAERVRAEVSGARMTLPDGSACNPITVSAGVSLSHAHPEASIADLIACADRALYRSKAAGRDCVRFEAVA